MTRAALARFLANAPPRPNAPGAPGGRFSVVARFADALGAAWDPLGRAADEAGARDIAAWAAPSLGDGAWLVRLREGGVVAATWVAEGGALWDLPPHDAPGAYPLTDESDELRRLVRHAMPAPWESSKQLGVLAGVAAAFAPRRVAVEFACACAEAVAGYLEGGELPVAALLDAAMRASGPPAPGADGVASPQDRQRLWAAAHGGAAETSGGFYSARVFADVVYLAEARSHVGLLKTLLDVVKNASIALMQDRSAYDAEQHFVSLARAKVPYSDVLRGLLAANAGDEALEAHHRSP